LLFPDPKDYLIGFICGSTFSAQLKQKQMRKDSEGSGYIGTIIQNKQTSS